MAGPWCPIQVGAACTRWPCLLRLPEAADHRATAAAWRRQLACSSAEQLSAEQLLAFLRLGQGDSHLFGRLLPRLQRLAADLQPQERLGLLESAAQVGRMQFPLDGREADAMEEGFRALRQSEARSQPQAPQLLALERELDWLAALVQARVERLFHRQGGEANLPLIPESPSLPAGLEDASPWAQLVNELAAGRSWPAWPWRCCWQPSCVRRPSTPCRWPTCCSGWRASRGW